MRYTIQFSLLILALFVSLSGNAQTLKAYEKAGDEAYLQKEYYAAAKYYSKALEMDKDRMDLVYKYANSCREYNYFTEADKMYRRIASRKEKSQFPLLFFWQGTVNQQMGEYKTAIKLLERYLKVNTDSNSFYHKKAMQHIASCKTADQIISDPVDVEINWLGDKVNSPYSEFAPAKIGDQLYFSSLKYKVEDESNNRERFFAKIYASQDEAKGKMQLGYGSKEEHLANTAFSEDGTTVYYTQCNGTSNADIKCQIFSRVKSENRWQRPQPLPADINLDGYTTTHPSIAFDSVTNQEVLFFVSDRPNGEGKLDIWYSYISNSGAFSAPFNAGKSINTPDDDITPYFDTESQTLFFSSNWHPGLGGFDIFSSTRNGKTWSSAPENLGYPVNSSYNDVYYVLNKDNPREGYLSSNREGSLSLTQEEACCNDLYAFKYPVPPPPPEPEPEPIPEPEPPVVVIPPPNTSVPPPPVVFETPKPIPPTAPLPTPTPEMLLENLNSSLPVTLYFHNDEPDSNTLAIVTQQNYIRHYDWYYSMKEEYKTKYALGNSEDSYRVDDFFEYKVKKGRDDLIYFTENLLELLNAGMKIKVSIKGYTSPRSPSNYNFNLAKRRIDSGKNFFREWRGGILNIYIRKGLLQIVETPLGETQSPEGIADAYSDRRNSIFSVEASQERRIEIIDVSRE